MSIIKKQIAVKDQLFEFQINTDTMTIINQREYKRMRTYYSSSLRSMVRNLAAQLTRSSKRSETWITVDDLIQELDIVLVSLICRYDPTIHNNFNALFWKSCRNKIIDILRKTLHTREIKRYKKTKKDWLAEQAKQISQAEPLSSFLERIKNREDFDGNSGSYRAESIEPSVIPLHVAWQTLMSRMLKLDHLA